MKVLCFLSCHHNTKAELFFIFKPPNQKRIIAWECLKQQKGRRKSRKCGEISTVNLFAVDVFISQCFVRLFVCAQTSSQAFKMRSHYLWGPSLLDGIWVSRKIVIRNKVCLCFYRSKCLQMMRQLMFHSFIVSWCVTVSSQSFRALHYFFTSWRFGYHFAFSFQCFSSQPLRVESRNIKMVIFQSFGIVEWGCNVRAISVD